MPGRIGALRLGAELALGSRAARGRAALTAVGVALGVVVLLLAASVPHVVAARKHRADAISPLLADRGPLSAVMLSTRFHGVTISETALSVTGPARRLPVPPGLTGVPGPGQIVVSPAVARLMRGPGGTELRRRIGGRVVATIAPSGLVGPGDALVYRGARSLPHWGVSHVRSFGGRAPTSARYPITTLLAIVIVVALLLPVGVFVATATRFGTEERDRRLAAIRLIGADRATTARVAVGESLVGALAGLALGAAAFLVVRPFAGRAGLAGIDAFAGDVRPTAVLAAVVAVLVPLIAVAATLLAIRRVAIEPLHVSRRSGQLRRRLWWRLLAPAAGFAVLAPMVGSGHRLTHTGGQIEATAGVVLVLVGVAALLPWLVEAAVRRAPDGPLPWLLAVRRLRREEGTAGRIVGAIGLAVAGAIALSIVFGAAVARIEPGADAQRAGQTLVSFGAPTRPAAVRDLAALRRTTGVASVRRLSVGRWPGGDLLVNARVALSRGASAEPLRDRVAQVDPYGTADTGIPIGGSAHVLSVLRGVLVAGSLVVLGMIGASLLIATGEGLRERRGALSVLGAVGARPATLAGAMLWQAAIPVAGGLVLAVGLGIGLGAVLSAVVSVSPVFDWGSIALMLAAGAAVIAAVTVLTLPTLGAMMRPEALRVE